MSSQSRDVRGSDGTAVALATNLTLGTVVVLLCATITRPAHGIAVLLLVVLPVLRLERTGGEG